MRVSHRPLATVSALTIGDYVLWNWSLNGNHDVLALVSGLTLPPLAIAFAWLLVLTVARLFAGRRRGAVAKPAPAPAQPVSRSGSTSSPSSSSPRRSRKIAA